LSSSIGRSCLLQLACHQALLAAGHDDAVQSLVGRQLGDALDPRFEARVSQHFAMGHIWIMAYDGLKFFQIYLRGDFVSAPAEKNTGFCMCVHGFLLVH
jgi:hypothetical protein